MATSSPPMARLLTLRFLNRRGDVRVPSRGRRGRREITADACRSSQPPLIEDQRPDHGGCQDQDDIARDTAEYLMAEHAEKPRTDERYPRLRLIINFIA